MFRKRKRNRIMFLLIMDSGSRVWDIPEETLWLNFNDALDIALGAVTRALRDEGESADIDILSMEIEENDSAFLAGCFEIMPISISSPKRITWWGKESKRWAHENL